MQIINLTDSVGVAGQVQPGDMPAIAEAGYKVVINNRPDAESADQPGSAEIAEAARAAGLEYHYYPLNAMNYPGDDPAAMAALFDDESRPVFAFCRSGTRSSNLWISTRGVDTVDSARRRARDLGFDISMSLR
ncbi:MAG: TIGR01244 family sulfur transferase [Chromatocurvus sp.]